MKKKILFFLPEDSVRTNGVYRSQIYLFAKALVRLGHTVMIACHDSNRDGGLPEFRRQCEADDIRLLISDKLNSRVFLGFNDWHFKRIFKIFRREIIQFQPTHIYTRHPLATYAARAIRKATGATLIYSLRGVWPEEKAASGKWKDILLARLIQQYEFRAVRTADRINTVSLKFRDYIRSRYGRESSVLPCCTADIFFRTNDRLQKRRELGFAEDDLIIAYCGSTAFYQQIDKICQLMAALQRQLPQLKFLFVAKDPKVTEIALKTGLRADDLRQVSGKPEEVAAWLSAADAGMILRYPNLINAVSSPVKLGEYLASGLLCIANDGIGDYSDMIRQHGFGIMADRADEKTIAEFLLAHCNEDERRRRRAFAEQYCSWDGQREMIGELFA